MILAHLETKAIHPSGNDPWLKTSPCLWIQTFFSVLSLLFFHYLGGGLTRVDRFKNNRVPEIKLLIWNLKFRHKSGIWNWLRHAALRAPSQTLALRALILQWWGCTLVNHIVAIIQHPPAPRPTHPSWAKIISVLRFGITSLTPKHLLHMCGWTCLNKLIQRSPGGRFLEISNSFPKFPIEHFSHNFVLWIGDQGWNNTPSQRALSRMASARMTGKTDLRSRLT